jgi:hypothetical protein
MYGRPFLLLKGIDGNYLYLIFREDLLEVSLNKYLRLIFLGIFVNTFVTIIRIFHIFRCFLIIIVGLFNLNLLIFYKFILHLYFIIQPLIQIIPFLFLLIYIYIFPLNRYVQIISKQLHQIYYLIF